MAGLGNALNPSVKSLTESAIATIVSAAIFWVGCGTVLYNLFQKLAPAPNAPDALSWISAISLVVAGFGYIPLEIYQHSYHTKNLSSTSLPRRGLVLALLGGGILATAIGGVTALYLWVTAFFGSPVDNWQQTAHGGLATFIVGILLVSIYLWSAWKEGYWSRSGKQSLSSALEAFPSDALSSDTRLSDAVSSALAQSTAQSMTIEDTLDELLAGKLTRDEAAACIRMLLKGSNE